MEAQQSSKLSVVGSSPSGGTNKTAMKVEIDFDAKVIKVEKQVNFKRLMEYVQTLPSWEEYRLDTNSEIIWQSPVVIDRPVYPWRNPWDWWSYPTTVPYIQAGGTYTDNATYAVNLGVADTANGVQQFELQ